MGKRNVNPGERKEYDMGIDLILLLIVAGLGAGVVTGLAGASAATVVTPLLVTFTPIAAYAAITISLLADVFASFFSFLTYRKNGNINMKDGVYLTITACIGSVAGSYLSSLIGDDALGSTGGIMTLILGINFLRKGYIKYKNTKDPNYVEPVAKPNKLSEYNPALVSCVLGLILGLVCGIIGAGGGLMILFVLTAVLRYDTKTAIGTSVLIMTFTALSGGVAHLFQLDGVIEPKQFIIGLVIVCISAVVGAKVSAVYANKTEEYKLLMIVGATFTILTTLMFLI